MVAALDLGSSVSRRGGSSPFVRTFQSIIIFMSFFDCREKTFFISMNTIALLLNLALLNLGSAYNSFYNSNDIPCNTKICSAHDDSPSEPAIPDSAKIEKSFFELIKKLKGDNPDKIKADISDFLNKHSSCKREFDFAFSLAEKYLGAMESPTHNDLFFASFLENYLESEFPDNAEKQRASYLLEMARKNIPGSKASDFSFLLRDGSNQSLYEIKNKIPLLVIFYDPDCFHCLETFEEIKTADWKKLVEIIAIDAEEDKDLWQSSSHALPAEWTVGFAVDPIQDNETYVFQSMPTLYLLDNDKTVLLKDASPTLVGDFMKQIHKN